MCFTPLEQINYSMAAGKNRISFLALLPDKKWPGKAPKSLMRTERQDQGPREEERMQVGKDREWGGIVRWPDNY